MMVDAPFGDILNNPKRSLTVPEFIHHITLHFAIVLPMVLAVTGLYALRTDTDALIPLLRWGGHFTLAIAFVTAATGILAGGLTGGEEHLQHHRYLGILTTITIAIAALAFEIGIRRDEHRIRAFGLSIWWVASFATVGASHWGILAEHADVVPF